MLIRYDNQMFVFIRNNGHYVWALSGDSIHEAQVIHINVILRNGHNHEKFVFKQSDILSFCLTSFIVKHILKTFEYIN